MAVTKDICIRTTEMHTGGAPLRIVESGYPGVKGPTLVEKRKYVLENLDHLRKLLTFHPRGHSDTCGVLFVTPDSEEANMAALFFDNEGYSTMCGRSIIALGRYAVDRGFVKQVTSPETQVNIQCPSGLVRVFVEYQNGRTGRTRFHSLPAFAFATDLEVYVKGYGRLSVDIGYEGVFYALVPACMLGLDVRTAPTQDLVEAGMAVSDAVKAAVKLHHPEAPDMAFLHGTILTDGQTQEITINARIFADKGLDRSLCGSGIASTVAVQYAKRLLGFDQTRIFESGASMNRFTGKVIEEVKVGDINGVVVEVAGHAHYTGSSTFTLEEEDAMKCKFFLE